MSQNKKKPCRHRYDPTTICRGKSGVRGFPCKKCDAVLPIGTVAIRKP